MKSSTIQPKSITTHNSPKAYTLEEEECLKKEFDELLEIVEKKKLLKSEEEKELLIKFYQLGKESHKQGMHASGAPEFQRRRTAPYLPYFSHPIKVAKICAQEIGVGFVGIAGALLHDVIEDTYVDRKTIAQILGKKYMLVLKVVEAVTKLTDSNLNVVRGRSAQVANFQKWLTVLDLHDALLVKLADRLHNMRTMEHMDKRKKLAKAAETSYIYIPIARKLVLSSIIRELEDLSMKYRYSRMYNLISNYFKESDSYRIEYEREFKTLLTHVCRKQGLDFELHMIRKSIYSIFLKMENRAATYENIPSFIAPHDLYKINIIINKDEGKLPTKISCWKLYALLSEVFNVKTTGLKDWISISKGLGYNSLHVPLMKREGLWKGKWIKSRIRTVEMHEMAMQGYDAYFTRKGKGKGKEKGKEVASTGMMLFFGRLVDENLKKEDLKRVNNYILNMNDIEFDKFRDTLKYDDIIAYDGEGGSYWIPSVATVLDFAFRIGVETGLKCNGAKVNGIPTKLNYIIKHEDVVEIFTSEMLSDNLEERLAMTRTLNAKSAILQEMNQQKERKEKHNQYRIATCCNPMKGDEIFLYSEDKGLIYVHKTTCIKLLSQKIEGIWVENENDRNPLVRGISTDEIWRNKDRFKITIKIKGRNTDSMSKDLAMVFSSFDIISSHVATLDSNSHHFEGLYEIYVKEKSELEELMGKVYAIDGVEKCFQKY